ncbi:MAG TPA: BON domain-containing protein [Thermoanaerobaculia bacterium]|nr:BON domain-containing protein [Thermoanaerobaculia bacterium]
MLRFPSAALAAILLAAWGAQAQTASPGAAHASPKPDDASLRAAVVARLVGDARFARIRKIDVDPAKGLVTLTGMVPTAADRAAAGELVSGVKGVQIIYNELEVEHAGR